MIDMCSKTLQHTAVSEIGLCLSGDDLSPFKNWYYIFNEPVIC